MPTRNAFIDLEPREDLPPEHKKAVMESIEMAKLMVDFLDLFTAKRAHTESRILETLSKSNTKRKNK